MIYEYLCPVCSSLTEVKHSLNINPPILVFCKTCNRFRSMKRIISKTSFILKGRAWAKDGYCKVI